MFGDVLKITLFEAKLSIKVVSFYMQGHSGFQIKIRDYFPTFFDVTSPLTVSELANELLLQLMFFEVSTFASICVKFQ